MGICGTVIHEQRFLHGLITCNVNIICRLFSEFGAGIGNSCSMAFSRLSRNVGICGKVMPDLIRHPYEFPKIIMDSRVKHGNDQRKIFFWLSGHKGNRHFCYLLLFKSFSMASSIFSAAFCLLSRGSSSIERFLSIRVSTLVSTSNPDVLPSKVL